MPVHKIPGGYQYGQSGKKYYGKDAKKKALKQQLAIELSGYTETKLPRSKRTTRFRAVRHSSNQIPLTSLTQDLVELGAPNDQQTFRKGRISYGKTKCKSQSGQTRLLGKSD